MYRMAILGVGWAGQRQIEAARELDRKVSVTCLVDNDPVHLKSIAAEWGIAKTYTRMDEALADPDVDAVSICLPHTMHCPVALAAAEAGKHILCEKPIALTVEDATRMIETADGAGVKLYVAENQAYSARASFLRPIVQTGETIGEPTHATLTAGFGAQDFGYPGRRAWLTQLDQGGTGTWMLQGIHSMAELRTIFGEVETVYAREHKATSFVRRELEGTVSGLFTLRSGLHISILQTSETRLPDNLKGYTVFGDQGSVRAGTKGCEVFGGKNGDEALWIEYPQPSLSDYAQEIEAFADYVAGLAQGPTTGRSERRSLAIVQAGYESMLSGQPVHLPTRFGDLD